MSVNVAYNHEHVLKSGDPATNDVGNMITSFLLLSSS